MLSYIKTLFAYSPEEQIDESVFDQEHAYEFRLSECKGVIDMYFRQPVKVTDAVILPTGNTILLTPAEVAEYIGDRYCSLLVAVAMSQMGYVLGAYPYERDKGFQTRVRMGYLLVER